MVDDYFPSFFLGSENYRGMKGKGRDTKERNSSPLRFAGPTKFLLNLYYFLACGPYDSGRTF